MPKVKTKEVLENLNSLLPGQGLKDTLNDVNSTTFDNAGKFIGKGYPLCPNCFSEDPDSGACLLFNIQTLSFTCSECEEDYTKVAYLKEILTAVLNTTKAFKGGIEILQKISEEAWDEEIEITSLPRQD